MDAFEYALSTTMFLMCSPQFIAEHKESRDVLLRARDNEVLQLVAIDEPHLFAMHGRRFRDPIRFLQREFFAHLHKLKTTEDYQPLLMATTATQPVSLQKHSPISHKQIGHCHPIRCGHLPINLVSAISTCSCTCKRRSVRLLLLH